MGYYSEIASKEGMSGISMSTSSPVVMLTGGKVKILGTNPLSFSIPYKKFPLTVDFSTAKISRGLVYKYFLEGKELPIGCAVDKNGNPTRNPKLALEGGLLPFDTEEKKGFFISMLISILAGPLIGGVSNNKVTGTRFMNEKPNKGDFFIAIDIEKLTDKKIFQQKVKDFIRFIKKHYQDFRVPNERAYRDRTFNLKKGIIIPLSVKEIFERYGV